MYASGEGTVLSFDKQRGIGYILTDDNNTAYFHYSSIVSKRKFKTVKEQSIVQYTLYPKFREDSELLVKELKELK